jgi:high-affinity iron transporter
MQHNLVIHIFSSDVSMLVPFLIMLREGIEAALIVGIIAAYLKQIGHQSAMPKVWAGVVLAVLLCAVVGVALEFANAEFPQKAQELFEAVVGLAAVGILTGMVFWMKTVARSIKATLHGSIDAAIAEGSGAALIGMAFFAVAREGLESVVFLIATFQQDVGIEAPIGAALGLTVAIIIGAAITYGGARINLSRFFRWTGIFILFVAAGLLAGAVRSLHEAGWWNGLQKIAFDLSPVLPADGLLGTLLAGIFGYQEAPTIGEVLAYLIFLLPALVLFVAPARAIPPVREVRQ